MSDSEVRTRIYLQKERKAPPRPVPHTDDDAYRTDAAWRLLDLAQRLGGSAPGADASRLDEDLYGPVAR